MSPDRTPKLVFMGYGTDVGLKRCELLDKKSRTVGTAKESPGSTAEKAGFSLRLASREIAGRVVLGRRSEIESIDFRNESGKTIGSLRTDGGGWILNWNGRHSFAGLEKDRNGHPRLYFRDFGAIGKIGFRIRADMESPAFLLPRNLLRAAPAAHPSSPTSWAPSVMSPRKAFCR